MAETITITEQDRVVAENTLEQFLVDTNPDNDYSKGSALRDLVINGLAFVYAFLKKERDLVRARQSLLLLGSLSGASVDDAVDEILSNWFLTRKEGRQSTGSVTVYVSEAEPVNIPTTTRFYKTADLVYKPNSATTLTYSEDDMTPVVDTNGTVTSYSFRVPLISTGTGLEYNVGAGSFVDYSDFSPYVLRVENNAPFTGAEDTETTQEMLERAPTAISVRDLNSARSIDVTLKEGFSQIDDVTVFGYGDAEMIRDLILEEATGTRIHSGGFVDAYLRTPLTVGKTYTAEVGAIFTDPRPGNYVLRDDTVADFVSAGVAVGDVIQIYNNEPGTEAGKYIVKRVEPKGVFVSRRFPFPARPTVVENAEDGTLVNTLGQDRVGSIGEYTFSADDVGRYLRVVDSATSSNIGTWEITSVNTVSNYAVILSGPTFTSDTGVEFEVLEDIVDYSIGGNSPNYNNHVSRRVSGRFTRSIQGEGRIVLPFEPIYRITDVSFPSSGAFPAAYEVDNRVTFPNRVNEEPTYQVLAENLEYQVIGNNPEESFSGYQLMELDVGWPDGAGLYEQKDYFNGQNLRVTYDALTGYDAIWAYMIAGDVRILCGSVIPKGFHPVYLTLDISYRLSKTATANINQTEVATALVEYINSFDTRLDMDTSDIVNFLRANYAEIGYVAPLTVNYDLLAPDGRVIAYQSQDQITIDPDKHRTPGDALSRLDDPLEQGVSDNTVRYLTATDLITFTLLG